MTDFMTDEISENIPNTEHTEHEESPAERPLPDVQLRPVDSCNWKVCVDMSVTSEQEEFVAENWYSLLQWKFSENETLHPYCVYADNTVVGFIMYSLDPETHRWTISRFMIDAKSQNKGYGKAALLTIMRMVRESLGNIAFYTTVDPGNDTAIRLYENAGFTKTGEVLSHEDVYKTVL